ncbi:hypothetical protein [Actinopolymorpha pittospori]
MAGVGVAVAMSTSLTGSAHAETQHNPIVTEFPVTPSSGPTFIAAGPGGTVWFTEFLGNKIGRITGTGDITCAGNLAWTLLATIATATLVFSPLFFWAGPALLVLASEAIRALLSAAHRHGHCWGRPGRIRCKDRRSRSTAADRLRHVRRVPKWAMVFRRSVR